VPILLGGLAALIAFKLVGQEHEKEAEHRGVLFGSGLIAGESLMGIIIALFIFVKLEIPGVRLPGAAQSLLSIIALLGLTLGLLYLVTRIGSATPSKK